MPAGRSTTPLPPPGWLKNGCAVLPAPDREFVADIRQLEQRITAIEARIKTAVAQSNTSLLERFGVGPVLAATFLGEVGDIRRFPSKHHFAAHTGTAPLEAPAARSSATGCPGPGTAS